MIKKPEYLHPITDKKVIETIEKAFSDTSKRDQALEKYRKEKAKWASQSDQKINQ